MDEEQIMTEFKERQRRQRALSLSGIVSGAIGLGAAYILPCSFRLPVYAVTIAAVLSVLYRSFKNWRCPACNKLFGKRIDIDSCPYCKFKF